QESFLLGGLHIPRPRDDADDVGNRGAGSAWSQPEFAGSDAAHARHSASVRSTRSGGCRNACGDDVGEQFLPPGLERDPGSRHHLAPPAKTDEFDAAGGTQSRREPVRQYFRHGLGTVVYVAGSDVFLFFKTPASYAGLGAFGLAAVGMLAGSLLGKPAPPTVAIATGS